MKKKESVNNKGGIILQPLKNSFTELNRRFFLAAFIDFLFVVVLFLATGMFTAILRAILNSYKAIDPIVSQVQDKLGKPIAANLESLEAAKEQLQLIDASLGSLILKLILFGLAAFIVFCIIFVVFKGYSWSLIKNEKLGRKDLFRMFWSFALFYLVEGLLMLLAVSFLNDKAGYYGFFAILFGFIYLQWIFFIVYDGKKKIKPVVQDVWEVGVKKIYVFIAPVIGLAVGVVLAYNIFNLLIKAIMSVAPMNYILLTYVYGIGMIVVIVVVIAWFKHYMYQAAKISLKMVIR